jgi:hypothetical protein
MIKDFGHGRVYVFMDAANLENTAKGLEWWVDEGICSMVRVGGE